jgi:hypothetical protein
MLGTRADLKKGLAALSGLAIFLLILFIPSLPYLPIISMLLCLTSFGYIVTVSLSTSKTERTREQKFADRKLIRSSILANDMLNPDENLSQASRQTLRREAHKGSIEEDVGNAVNFRNLQPPTKKALENEVDRLLDPSLQETPEKPEDRAVIIGIGAIFAIINGLGISEALLEYFNSLVVNINSTFQDSLTQIVTLDLPYTYRILGFLATIIPFIHGFVLTVSTKWYYNAIRKEYHLRLAFLFFIAVFIHTVLFYLLAVNVEDISRYILFLWTILLFNILWLPCQSALTYSILGRTDAFLHEWIVLNFNTMAYLSVFIFAYPDLLKIDNTVGNDEYLNLQITLVLILRTASDYIVGWRKIYNKQT